MSGEAEGLVIVPLAIAALPIVGMFLIGGAVAAGVGAAGKAAVRYEEKKRREREEIRKSGLGESIGSFRSELASNMNEQRKLNMQVSDRMMAEMNKNRQELMNLINNGNPEKYQQYMRQLSVSHQELSKQLFHMQDEFVKNYHKKIDESMNNVTNVINAQYAGYLQELQNLQMDQQAKSKKAQQIADEYIEEAKNLIFALENDYEAKKYANLQLIDLQRTLNVAIDQYNKGNYESTIATAKSVSLDTIREIYEADCKKQEWENLYKCAFTLSAELEAYMMAQKTVTAEVKEKVEQQLGKKIEDEIIGVQIPEYTDRMKNGICQYDYLLGKVCEIKKFLESENAESLSNEQMREYVEILHSKLYPSVQMVIYKGILNMSNAFSRQNISEEIIDFFEDHNFNFTGYNYDDDKHDGALHIGLQNDTTGEEIIVTLAPELMKNGEVQTKVEIDQLHGDETNEARKEFFRNSVRNAVVENTPGAQITLECKKETKNRLSRKTELRDKLKM